MALFAIWGGPRADASFVSYQVLNGGLETFGYTIDGRSDSGYAGGIRLVQQGPLVSSLPTDWVSVCTDFDGVLYLGYTYTYSAPQTFAGQIGLKPTWGRTTADAPAAIQNAAHIYESNKGLLTTGELYQKAAVQLAVWEALYDTGSGLSLSDGRFTVEWGDQQARDLATGWLSGLSGNYGYAGSLLIPDPVEQYGKVGQELLYTVTPNQEADDPPSVPEPAPMLMSGLATVLFGLLGVRSLRKRQNYVPAGGRSSLISIKRR